MFIKEQSNKIIHLILYVEDMLIIYEYENEVNWVIYYLKDFYLIISLGEVKYFLLIEICRKEVGSYLLSWINKTNQSVKDLEPREAKLTYILMEINYNQSKRRRKSSIIIGQL